MPSAPDDDEEVDISSVVRDFGFTVLVVVIVSCVRHANREVCPARGTSAYSDVE